MSRKINPIEILRVGLILFCITAVAALLLAFVNGQTAPLVEANQTKKTMASMKTVMSEAKNFEKVDYAGEDVLEAYLAKGPDNKVLGACVVVKTVGYGGDIKMLAGVDKNGTLTGIDILSHGETPGLGANASKPDFKDQFQGKSGGIEAVKAAGKDNTIQAMSGATITSKAVTKGANTALDAGKKIMANDTKEGK